jgi:predicted MFS family arabinose efflux permease
MGFFAWIVATLNYLLVRNPPAEDLPKNVQGAGLRAIGEQMGPTYRALLTQRLFWRIGLSYALVGFTVLVPYTYLSTFAVEHLKFEYPLAARLITVIAVCGLLGKVVIGFLSDRLGRVPMMMASNLLMGAGCAGLALWDGTVAVFCFTGLFGLGFGAVWPVYAAAAPDHFAKQSAGAVIGLWTVFLGVGSIISPVVCGWVIDVSGGYGTSFLMGAAASAAAMALLVPRRWG